ncbi:MAG: 2,3-bisphosphoglycerate-independent phosphoglycerate mutase [Candidatus Micrarchaeia archaeon]
MLVVLDGAADRKNAVLRGMTPLQDAHMNNLNNIARRSAAGMMYPIAKGIAPESDSAVFSLLSYDIKRYTGRGAIEAYGSGINVRDNDLALRTNFATVDNELNIIDRRAGRSITRIEARGLEYIINKIKLSSGVQFRFKATIGHRGVVVFYGNNAKLSQNISNADIGYARKGSISIAQKKSAGKLLKVVPLTKDKSAAYTANIVNEFIERAHAALSAAEINNRRKARGFPEANALLLRDAGLGLPKVEFIGKKFGMRFSFITEMPVENGIAKLLGMREIRFRSALKGESRYSKIAALAKMHASECDFMYIHIKGPDEPGHDGNAIAKAEVLKEIDSGFFSHFNGEKKVRICVTCDHSTPCELKAHSSDPVPVIISGIASDNMNFDESIDSKGSLGIFRGVNLIKKIISG